MSLHVTLTDEFIRDLDLQQDWYTSQHNPELGLAYIASVDRTMRKLAEHPSLGRPCGFRHERLVGLRRYVVRKPFESNIVFYRVEGTERIGFRVVSRWRNLPERLLDPPGAH